jgi:hypothetical protein
MSQMIKESESIQENFINCSKKTKFLEMNQIFSNENHKQMLFLLFYDIDYSNMSKHIFIKILSNSLLKKITQQV